MGIGGGRRGGTLFNNLSRVVRVRVEGRRRRPLYLLVVSICQFIGVKLLAIFFFSETRTKLSSRRGWRREVEGGKEVNRWREGTRFEGSLQLDSCFDRILLL